MFLWHWFLWFTGLNAESGRAYGFWSGFGGSIPDFLLIGTLITVYRRHKCQTCWRPALKGGLGRVEGTHYETCHRHTNKDQHSALIEQHKARHPEMHEHLKGTVTQ